MKIWFPRFYTEGHRQFYQGQQLVSALAEFGVKCYLEMDYRCDLIFCGSFACWREVQKQRQGWKVPVVHYNWDIYPFQVNGDKRGETWKPYLQELEQATEVWVPSECTVKRTEEYTGRSAVVVKCSVRPFAPPCPVRDGGYVVDVMRKYPDPNRDLVAQTCERLGIPCIETRTERSWEEFQRIIANARLLVSGYWEASTGGLSLLEGHWLGKPVLLCDSPRNGGVDYFGDRATYFRWNDSGDFVKQLSTQFANPTVWNPEECQQWITEQYSDRAMARRMVEGFQRILS